MVESLKAWLAQQKIESLKYQFTDLQGNIREVTLNAEGIPSSGMTATDGSSVYGKIIPPTESDMLLIPDEKTLMRVPGKDNVARVLCNVYHPPVKEGSKPAPFEGDPRGILAKVENSVDDVLRSRVEKLHRGRKVTKFHAHFAPELEFIFVPKDYDHAVIHRDQRLQNNNYFVPPEEVVDNALQEILRNLGACGLKKEKYHTEVTTNQCEVGIGHGNVLAMADATMMAKNVISKVGERHGLRASFIPKFRKGVNGSGMHVHQNLAATLDDDKERNLFFDESKKDGLSEIGRQYFAGLLFFAQEITAITNPRPVSYKRLVPGCEAPTYIAWDWQNRTALCRGHSPSTHKVRVEYRATDPLCNPYLAYAAMLSAGLEGIERRLKLCASDKRDFYHDNTGIKELPGDLGESLALMNKSVMLRKRMGCFVIDALAMLGKREWKSYCQDVSDVDIARYF